MKLRFFESDGATIKCPWVTAGSGVVEHSFSGCDLIDETTYVVRLNVIHSLGVRLPSSNDGLSFAVHRAKLIAQLSSSGDITNASGDAFSAANNFSSPILESFFKMLWEQSVGTGLGHVTSSGALYYAGTSVIDVAPYLFSVSRSPGDGSYFALQPGGQIVGVSASTGQPTEYSTATCPLKICQVPVWLQSISIGMDQRVFGLDHGGQIYELNADGTLTTLPDVVSPTIQQVSYF